MKAMRMAKKHVAIDARICFAILVRLVCPMSKALLSEFLNDLFKLALHNYAAELQVPHYFRGVKYDSKSLGPNKASARLSYTRPTRTRLC